MSSRHGLSIRAADNGDVVDTRFVVAVGTNPKRAVRGRNECFDFERIPFGVAVGQVMHECSEVGGEFFDRHDHQIVFLGEGGDADGGDGAFDQQPLVLARVFEIVGEFHVLSLPTPSGNRRAPPIGRAVATHSPRLDPLR